MNCFLKEFINGEFSKIDEVFIWGTGSLSEKFLKRYYIDISGYIDNNADLWGQELRGKMVLSPKELALKDKDRVFILIASSFYKDIEKQLNELGFREKTNYLNVLFFEYDLLVQNQLEDVIMLLGKLNVNRIKGMKLIRSLEDAEFRAFSQWGEDGIIQYMINNIDIQRKIFVEFGVSNYVESNTRFLLMNNNWTGLVIDGSEDNVEYIKNDSIYWRYDLTALCRFINAENINSIISSVVKEKDIGILSIDIDGNDYWVWKAIETVSPRIVICEYNSLFGAEHALTIPYEPQFYRTQAHFSNLYFGCSLLALCDLADKKGYTFIGTNTAGNNAFFVRMDLSDSFNKLSASEGYVKSKFRESRDEKGNLNFLFKDQELRLICELPIFDTRLGKMTKIKDVLL